MHSRFAELDWASTRIGEISLRRRLEPTTKTEVYEVKLGDEYLMSSLFTVAEEELARLTLAARETSRSVRRWFVRACRSRSPIASRNSTVIARLPSRSSAGSGGSGM